MNREERSQIESARQEKLLYIGMMLGCGAAMPQSEREELLRWEASSEFTRTTGWPGWEKYIGPPPANTGLQYVKRKLPKSLRLEVFRRDGLVCKNCGSNQRLTVDHIIPESKGGSDDPENLQTLCSPCNSRKRCR